MVCRNSLFIQPSNFLKTQKIYLKNKGDKLSFRCFAMDMNKNVLYLPAFGDLTGGYPCKKSFKKWAIVSEEEIIEIKS